MDNKLNEMLNNLKEMLAIATIKDYEKLKEKISNLMEEAIKEPCKITIEKTKHGEAKMSAEGQRLALLINLAGAEQGILKQLSCDDKEFEFIKNLIGGREANDNE